MEQSVWMRGAIMGKKSIEPGWQRFLDRLKRLWGKLRGGGFPQEC
jgi:hypothetical protein